MKDLIETHDNLRPLVEEILKIGSEKFNLPSCLSQSYRASRLIKEAEKLPLRERINWFYYVKVLKEFVVLNEAIRILEREVPAKKDV